MKKKNDQDTTITTNRKAFHDYTVLSHIEAGIKLTGTEVKSCRSHSVNLQDSYVDFNGNQAEMVNGHITPYENGNIFNHTAKRKRKLLLHKKEILKISQQTKEKGLTVVPLKMYFKGSLVKVDLGVCKGKTFGDKRETLRDKQQLIETKRTVRNKGNEF